MGIQKNLDDLSYAEKRLLIMVSLTDQLKQSQDDYGRSIESVANQTKIMNEQWHRLSRAVGQMFMPIIQRVLPYVNAILMVLAEIANLVSSLLGFNLEDYDFFSGMSESAIDLEESLKGVDEQNKKLKSGLRGFDKLNNMITPSASGTSGGIGGGISPEIQKAFNKALEDYNKQLTEVKMKANKIRDSILDWLGFTDGTYKNLKLIGIILGTIVGLKILKFISGLITGTSTLGKLLGTGGLFKTISKLIKPIKILGAKDGLHYIFLKGVDALKKFLPLLGKVVIVAGSIYAIFSGSKGVKKSIEEMTKSTKIGGKEFGEYAFQVGRVVAGGALLGSFFGPVGTLVGALAGTVIAGVSAWSGYKKALEDIARGNLFGELRISTEQWLEALESSGDGMSKFNELNETFKNNMDDLKGTFDNSTSQLDIYGIRFGVLGKQISEEDLPLITSAVDSMSQSTLDMIDTSTNHSLSLWKATFEGMSGITQLEQENIFGTMVDASEEQKVLVSGWQEKINKIYTTASKERRSVTKEEMEEINELQEKIAQFAEIELSKSHGNMVYWESMIKDDRLKLNEESYENLQKALNEYKGNEQEAIDTHYASLISAAQTQHNKMIALGRENESTYQDDIANANDWREQEQSRFNDRAEELEKKYFGRLEEEYKKGDKTTRKIIDGLYKHLGKEPPKIKLEVDADTTKAKNKLSKFFGNFSLNLGSLFGGGGGGGRFASGGLPPVGQMFIANERGPELVGQIGGQSFVANQNQMMDLLDKKIGGGSGVNNATFVIQVGDEQVGKVVLNNLQEMAKSNGKPITIG